MCIFGTNQHLKGANSRLLAIPHNTNMCFARTDIAPNAMGVVAFRLLLATSGVDPEEYERWVRLWSADATDTVGRSVLMMAAANGDDACCEILCRAGADVELRDDAGWTAMMVAADAGNVGTVKLLMLHGADPTVQLPVGASPLMLAAQCGFTDVCELLMEFGADPNETDKNGMTALMCAARSGYSATCNALLDGGALLTAVSNTEQFALEQAAHFQHVDASRVLVRATMERVVATFGNDANPLLSPSCCQLLIGSLSVAVMANLEDEFRELIDVMSSVDASNDTDWSPLLFAARDGRAEMCKSLLGRGAMIDKVTTGLPVEQLRSALMVAAEHGHQGVCSLLLDAGATINLTNELGKSALQLCVEAVGSHDNQPWDASCNHLAVCTRLLKAGATPTAQASSHPLVRSARQRLKINTRKREQRRRKRLARGNNDPIGLDSSASPDAQPSDDDNIEACCVCFEETPCVLLSPCEHRCVCADCIQLIQATSGECPMCRVSIAAYRDAHGSEGFIC